MSEFPPNLPPACSEALKAIEADPLELSAAVRSHLATCRSCAESRLLWLAQEEAPPALAPAGYFERLPGRILGKLPTGRRSAPPRTGWLAAAAALLLLTAGGSFWAGRINREPLVVTEVRPSNDPREFPSETPFHDKYEVIEQFQNLSPEEAQALLKHLEKKELRAQP